MAIYRSLKTVIVKNGRKSFVTATTPLIQSPYTPLHALHYSPSPHSPHRFLSPLSKWIAPFHGPLFLSSPPWKLLQSSTPIHLHGNGVFLREVEALNLLNSRIGSVSARKSVLWDRVEGLKEETLNDGFFESYMNLPNFISLSGLVSGPLIGWMITHEMFSSSFLGLVIAGASDWLDGYVARKMKINSVVGSYLDPLADKVFIASVALAMVHMDLLHSALVGLIVFRDVVLIGGAVYDRASNLGWKWSIWYDFFNLDGTRPQKVEPLYISKVNTIFQLVLVAGALLQPEIGTEETQSCLTYMNWLVAFTTVASTVAYGSKYKRNKSVLLERKS